jgi:hypothetical protein
MEKRTIPQTSPKIMSKNELLTSFLESKKVLYITLGVATFIFLPFIIRKTSQIIDALKEFSTTLKN